MMDLEKIAAVVRDVIVGEIKEEFRDFRASVTGELSGFRLAIESLNARMGSVESRQSNIEQELRDVRHSIDETNKRIDRVHTDLLMRIDDTNKKIDETRAEIKAEVMANTARIDETNKRIDTLQWGVSEMRGKIEKAISDKEIVHDILIRVERLETGMAV